MSVKFELSCTVCVFVCVNVCVHTCMVYVCVWCVRVHVCVWCVCVCLCIHPQPIQKVKVVQALTRL